MKRTLSKAETERAIAIINNRDDYSEVERNREGIKLLKDYEGIIIQLATHYYELRKDITDMTDLVSAGHHGFSKALRTYDKDNAAGAQFVTYVRKGVQMEILGAYRKQVSIKGVEANTFTDMAPKTTADSDFDDGDILGMSIQKDSASSLVEDIEVSSQCYLRHNNKLSLVEELRHDPFLSIKESILLFVSRGIGTTPSSIKEVALQLKIKNEATHLTHAKEVLQRFRMVKNPAKTINISDL